MAIELRKATKAAWRRLMFSDEGKEGMLWLHEQIPNVQSDGKNAEQIIFNAGISEGFRRAFDAIQNVIAAESKSEIDPSND